MQRMRWYQAGCFTLALALGVAVTFLFDLTPEEAGYWVLVYAESVMVIVATVAIYQQAEEGRVDWIGIARAVLLMGRYSAAALIFAVPAFVLQSFFPTSWLETLNRALALGFAFNVAVILVLATWLSWAERHSFADVLLYALGNDRK